MKPLLLGIAAILLGSAAQERLPEDPLTRPIEPEYAARWLGEQPPLRVYGNSYLVGFEGLSVALIRTRAGLILIDGAVPQSAKRVEAHIRALGFRLTDVRYILSTEPHFDHAGGIPALARDSGATVLASADAAKVLRTGHQAPDDPQYASRVDSWAVGHVRAVRDGEAIRLGDVTVTARATPGHTSGSMSWTWASCEAGKCRNMVFASSLNPVSAGSYRFRDHPQVVARFRRSQARMAALPCDILITAHPDNSGGDRKAKALLAGARPNPFVDPGACRAYAGKSRDALDARLAKEGGN